LILDLARPGFLDYLTLMATECLDSARGVVDALGGVAEVMVLTGMSNKSVWSWQADNSFPPRFYFVMTEELGRRGYTAPATLWRMAVPADVSGQ
jgi:hypothetical protein